jgi:hypothetical protein
MEKIKITFIVSLLGIFNFSSVFAINVAGMEISNSATAAEFVVYLFNLGIAVGTFIAAIVLIMAGIDYVSSRGEPAKIGSAKSKIKNAFLGLVVLLSSFMILNIINPELTNIKINELKNEEQPEIIIPEGTGVYLYDSPGYFSTGDPLRVIKSKASFTDDNFNNTTQSIKFVNPENGEFKFGAILFAKNANTGFGSGYDFRGNCSYILDSIPDLSATKGQENNPAIGNNKLSSIIVFKTKAGSPSITIYNSPNCKKRTEEYGPQKDEENKCTMSGSSGFTNIKDACPEFKGDIVSISTGGDVGVLFKAASKEAPGRCHFFESNNNGCINTPKYSYTYNLSIGEYSPSVVPQSFILFPLVK